MIIICDTREQRPFSFRRWDVEVQRAALQAGDYSLPGFEDRVAVERKSLDDLIGCFMGENRTRFEKELAKGRSYELFAVVVEASLESVARGDFTSNMNPEAALQSVSAFWVRYRIPFIFAGSRGGAEYMCYSLLSKFGQEIEKRYKALCDTN